MESMALSCTGPASTLPPPPPPPPQPPPIHNTKAFNRGTERGHTYTHKKIMKEEEMVFLSNIFIYFPLVLVSPAPPPPSPSTCMSVQSVTWQRRGEHCGGRGEGRRAAYLQPPPHPSTPPPLDLVQEFHWSLSARCHGHTHTSQACLECDRPAYANASPNGRAPREQLAHQQGGNSLAPSESRAMGQISASSPRVESSRDDV